MSEQPAPFNAAGIAAANAQLAQQLQAMQQAMGLMQQQQQQQQQQQSSYQNGNGNSRGYGNGNGKSTNQVQLTNWIKTKHQWRKDPETSFATGVCLDCGCPADSMAKCSK